MSTWRALPVFLLVLLPGCIHRAQPQHVPVPASEGSNAPSVPAVIERSEPLYSETAREARVEGIVILEGVVRTDGRFHLLQDDGELPRLYDTQADPLERVDLAASRPADVERLTSALDERAPR